VEFDEPLVKNIYTLIKFELESAGNHAQKKTSIIWKQHYMHALK